MPWTKTNYPASMKNLPVGARNVAIAIANAMLKENKKADEQKLISTAIKHAKNITAKSVKKKKTKIVAKKKVKVAAKRKITGAVKKKAKTVRRATATKPAKAKKRTPVRSAAVAKKATGHKGHHFTPMASAAKKKIKNVPESKAKNVVRTKANQLADYETERPVVETPVISKITHGDDLHFIPEKGEVHPIVAQEAKKVENIFHHREEVAFHQENERVKQSLSTRKGAKMVFRNRGRRS